jgi:hypothetical protein
MAWNGTRTAILRDARDVAVGEDILVKLERGELRSTVTARQTDGGE